MFMWHMQLFKRIALKPDFSGPIKSLNSIYSKLSKCHLRPFGPHGTNYTLAQKEMATCNPKARKMISFIWYQYSENCSYSWVWIVYQRRLYQNAVLISAWNGVSKKKITGLWIDVAMIFYSEGPNHKSHQWRHHNFFKEEFFVGQRYRRMENRRTLASFSA